MYQPLTLHAATTRDHVGHFERIDGTRVDVLVHRIAPDAHAVLVGGVLAGMLFSNDDGGWGVRHHGADGTCSESDLRRIPRGYPLHSTFAAAAERVASGHLADAALAAGEARLHTR